MSKVDELLKAVAKMHDKYLDLVWLARSDPECHPTVPDDIRAGCFVEQCRIQAAYPEEVAAISCPEHGDWAHGFNSGMLACLRFVETALADGFHGGLEIAKAEFPHLDT
jgi:hypothetical protein